jgi:DNA-binding IclR family transcriptional regulator
MRNTADGLSSVDNALSLLMLVQQRECVRVSDVAEALDIAPSTAHRLLATLRRRGFVTQDRPNGAYRPGWSLNELAFSAIERLDIRNEARPILEELRDATGETASLLLLEGRNVRFVDCVESGQSVRVGTRQGLVLPAHCTAGGKAILAGLPASELTRRYDGGSLEARTEASISTWEELVREVLNVRQCGFAVNHEEGESGVSAVGVAAFDSVGARVAGLAVAVPAHRMAPVPDAETVAALHRARRALESLLGPDEPAP